MSNNNSPGFSLIEASIVLVIIALITASIVAGKSILDSSKNLQVATGFTKYKIALETFKNRFNAYPGDFTRAMDYWGAQCGSNSAHTATSISGPLNDRCNGNGNMNIDWNTHETLKAFQHLHLANIIDIAYTGERRSVNPVYIPGINVPNTIINNNDSTYYIYYDGNYPIAGFTNISSHFLAIGEISSVIPNVNLGSSLTTSMAYYIDNKLDDNIPTTGNFRSVSQDIVYTTECLDGGMYNLSNKQKSQCKSLLMLE